MIVELRGTNTRNKGAELMLRSVAGELRGRHEVAVDPRAGSYDERARLGLLQKVGHERVPEERLARAGRLVPAKLRGHARRRYGLVLERDVGAVLDASGFAYTDQFDLHRSLVAADRAVRIRRRGGRMVLLPQALGPFTSPAHREAFVRLANHCDVVYAREPLSLEYARGSGCSTDHLRLAPDFTCLLEGEAPADFEASPRLALVVPSAKLLTHTSDAVREAYVPYFVEVVRLLRDQGLDVRMLLHERDDGGVIEQLQGRLEVRAPVVGYPSALHLKGVIASARIVVGSRFHALVSALSQGVPAVGVGWSHKYEMLFTDYGCPELVLDPVAGPDDLARHLGALADEVRREALVARLREAAGNERRRARVMWDEVLAVLESP